MKSLAFIVVLAALLLPRVEAQMGADSSATDTPPPAGATVITSDELNMDQADAYLGFHRQCRRHRRQFPDDLRRDDRLFQHGEQD